MLNVRVKSKLTGTWPNRSDKIGKRGLRTSPGLIMCLETRRGGELRSVSPRPAHPTWAVVGPRPATAAKPFRVQPAVRGSTTDTEQFLTFVLSMFL
jgi:hypothetical protein